MSASRAKKVKKIATVGARTAGDIISLILKIIGSIILIAVTTGIIFACIFLVYVKTNLTEGLDVRLEEFTLSLSSEIYGQDSETGNWEKMVTLQSKFIRKWVDYDEIPMNMEYALIAIEDQRFYRHDGVDWYRTAGAFVNMFLGMKDTFGGSTITQQLIKNLTEDKETTVQRKLTEIFRALEFEKEYDKDEIIEGYLNVVYFGHGRYGVGAAAEYYFGKDLSELSLAESAAIIGITNNPSMYSPYMNREKNKARQELILTKMYEQGYITQREYEKAVSEKLEYKRGEDFVYQEVIYSWFEEAVIEEVLEDMKTELGYSDIRARQVLYNGGLKIYATIDPALQEKMDVIYKNPEEMPKVTGSSEQLQSAMMIADWQTGEIKALSGGVGEKTGNMWRNRATRMRRPPGSSIKPLSVYAPAIEFGIITPETKFEDSADVTLEGTTWMTKNDDRSYRGIVTVRYAVQRSLNTISAQVLDKLKPSASYRFMRESLGFALDTDDENYAPLSLGQLTYGATLVEMASAYTMFPNQGARVELRTYTRVMNDEGALLLDNEKTTIPAISATTAYWMTDMLVNAATNGTGYEARLSNIVTAGKTGTTSDKKDRWFCGFTPYYVAVVWTGFDTPAAMSVSGNPAAQIWKRVMEAAHEGLEPKQFETPAVTQLKPVEYVREIEYTIRFTNAEGRVLQEQTLTGVIGREVSYTAPEVEGYRYVGETTVTITLGENPAKNIILFALEPIPVETSPEPEPPVTEPTGGEPPVTEPTDSEPPVTEPTETDPSVIEPPVSESPGGVVIPEE